jgi:hypothetical protein
VNLKKLEAEQRKLTDRFQQSVLETIERFKTITPEFHCAYENARKMVRFTEENNLDPAEIESYTLAYRVLQITGRLEQHLYTKTKKNKFVCLCRTSKREL